jgi:hypothetical protein
MLRDTIVPLVLLGGLVLIIAFAASSIWPAAEVSPYDPEIAAMVGEIDEAALYRTTYDLQNFSTRLYPSEGNRRAGTYIHDRLAEIPGLEVATSDDEFRNIIATLPGSGTASDETVIVGAHYDSESKDEGQAPGATDNGCGVAIVLELARVMSERRYDRTLVFACWNGGEQGMQGSFAFVADAAKSGRRIPLYLNFDAGYRDLSGTSVLDINSYGAAGPMADAMNAYNEMYGIDLTLTHDKKQGTSDHTPFKVNRYPALDLVMGNYQEVNTAGDTVDLVSLSYAKRLAQLGLVILAETAGVSG